MPKWVCPKCKAVIYTAMPQAMIRCPACGYKVKEKNPIRHTREGWFWGSVGPQPTRAALLRQVRAIYASGYRKRNPEMPIVYDPLLAERGEKGGVMIDPKTFTPKEIRIATGLDPKEERRVLAHEKLEWREAERAKHSGMSFGEYIERRLAGEKGPAHKWFPLGNPKLVIQTKNHIGEIIKRGRAIYASGYKGRNPEEKEIKALAPGMTGIDRKLIREAEETEIRDWLKKIQSTRDLVDRRKIIKDLIEIGKKEPDMIRVIGEVIKRGRLHEEIETMRLRKLLNPVSLYEAFHGSPPLRQRKISYEPPPKDKPLLKVGRISQINYIPEFPSKKSGQEFYHLSGDTGEKTLKSNLILATDSKGKNLYLLKDKKNRRPYFSGKRGIIG